MSQKTCRTNSPRALVKTVSNGYGWPLTDGLGNFRFVD